MLVTQQDIQNAISRLNLSEQVVCLHSSLRSFGRVAAGSMGVIQAFLDEGCTILVPTFSSNFAIAPPAHLRFERNGWNYEDKPQPDSEKIYSPDTLEIDRDMGVIPATILTLPDHLRGNHPFDSFTAIGNRAAELTANQNPLNVYAPLDVLIKLEGFVLLIGVGLERMTLVHLAEKEAGRTLFRRWAKDPNGQPITVEVGGCSEGFGKLESYLQPVMKKVFVGQSDWKLFPARETVELAAAVIRANPQITHCGIESCERCDDAVAGGTILP
jgi:aminoglycoside N3'-acetyltransferase